MVESIDSIHLHTSRVKTLDSLLRKVITKRHERLFNRHDPYSHISEENFQSIITDLAGVRLIMSYRGDWNKMHQALVSKFPYCDNSEYEKYTIVPHKEQQCFLAQIPVVIHAKNDDLSIFLSENVKTRLHEGGYRSVHYIVSYDNVYAEIQTWTIYDEAWSDCDHRYVYKHEENLSHPALLEMSGILNTYTNASNDLGEEIRNVFLSKNIRIDETNTFHTNEEERLRIDQIFSRYEEAQNRFRAFIDQLVTRKGWSE